MTFKIDNSWVYDTRKIHFDLIIPKELKNALFKASEAGFKYHKLVMNSADKKKGILFSFETTGYLMFEAIEERFANGDKDFQKDNYVFIEKCDGEYFVIAVLNGVLLLDRVVKHDYELGIAMNVIAKFYKGNVKASVITASDGNECFVKGSDGIDFEQGLNVEFHLVAPFINHIKVNDSQISLQPSNKITIKKSLSYKPFVIIGLILITLGLIVFAGEGDVKQVKKKAVNPYLKYSQTLESDGINVKIRMGYLFNDLSAFETLTGWEATSLVLQSKNTIINMKNDMGKFKELKDFGSKYRYQISKVKEDYTVISNVLHAPILRKAVLVPIDGVFHYIEEAIREWLPDFKIVNVSSNVSNGKWKEMVFSIQLDDWTKHDFDTLGTIINGLPVGFNQATLSYKSQTKSVSGTINLIIYGE